MAQSGGGCGGGLTTWTVLSLDVGETESVAMIRYSGVPAT
jgi:hypothetical protein